MHVSRRAFLHRSLLGASACAFASLAAAPATTQSADFASRDVFDRLDRAWNDGIAIPDQNNENGALAWGESYVLAAYLLMYQAHRDSRYLDKFIERADQVLKRRDSVRGVKDYRGRSLPAWRGGGRYTCGAIELKDAKGKPSLLIRSAARPASQVSVAVHSGARAGTFRIECVRKAPAKVPTVDLFDDLTMENAVARINGEFPTRNREGAGVMITAKDLRPAPDAAGIPSPAPAVHLAALHCVFAVHTGMIVQPLAGFARLVRETPELQASERYQAKADEYLDAAQQAADLFDHEWRENAETGEGWLIFARGSPSPFDGCDQPHNQYLALGRVFIELSILARTDDARQRYRDRATKMARTFKNDLKLGANHAYTWTYFWSRGRGYNGWTAADDISDYRPTGPEFGYRKIEDTSHAHIDIAFALRAFEAKLGVFTPQDLRRLARTFTGNMLTRDNGRVTVTEFVDGGGKKGMFENMAAAWSPLNRFDATILPSLRQIYATGGAGGNAQSRLLACALMNRAAAV